MKNIQALILDLDHCLYADPATKNDLYFKGAVTAALRLRLFEDFEKASQAVSASIKAYKSEIEGLIVDHGAERHSMFRAYHEDSLPLFTGIVTPVNGFAASLKHAVDTHELKVGLLTHSAREWAEPMVDHLGLSAIVPPQNIWAWNDHAINFASKSSSELPFLYACAALGITPDRAAMADDQEKNLIIPARLGMTTIQVVWDAHNDSAPKPSHLDYRVENLKHFLDRHFA